MRNPIDTAALLAAARGGDRVAAGELVTGMRGWAWLVARRYARRWHHLVAADELAAVGLAAVLYVTTRYDPAKAAGRGWVTYARAVCARAVSREAVRLGRQRTREAARTFRDPEEGLRDGMAAEPIAPDDAPRAAALAAAERVRNAVARLPSRLRVLVESFYGLTGPRTTLDRARLLAGIRRGRAPAALKEAVRRLRDALGGWEALGGFPAADAGEPEEPRPAPEAPASFASPPVDELGWRPAPGW